MYKGIALLRQAKGDRTFSEYAMHAKISPSMLSLIMSNKRRPQPDILKKLADRAYNNVSYEDLMTAFGYTASNSGVRIPVLGTIPAGIPIEAIETVLDYEEISPDLARSGKFFGLKVKGDSMEPKLLEDDIIIVKQTNEATTGSICVVMVNGHDATVKRIKVDSNGLWLLPENPKYNAQFFDKKQIETLPVKIIGLAIEVRRYL